MKSHWFYLRRFDLRPEVKLKVRPPIHVHAVGCSLWLEVFSDIESKRALGRSDKKCGLKGKYPLFFFILIKTFLMSPALLVYNAIHRKSAHSAGQRKRLLAVASRFARVLPARARTSIFIARREAYYFYNVVWRIFKSEPTLRERCQRR